MSWNPPTVETGGNDYDRITLSLQIIANWRYKEKHRRCCINQLDVSQQIHHHSATGTKRISTSNALPDSIPTDVKELFLSWSAQAVEALLQVRGQAQMRTKSRRWCAGGALAQALQMAHSFRTTLSAKDRE
jgi:hypothetical protein